MMKLSIFVGVLGAFTASVLCSKKIDASYKSKVSLYKPYVDRVTGRVQFGDLAGSCSIVSMGEDAGVHLTSTMDGSTGSITSRIPLSMENWRIDAHFSVKKGARGAGIWIMKEFQPGQIFGGNEQFNGILVYLALMENKISGKGRYPKIGLATAYGGAPVVHFERDVKFIQDCMIRLQFVNGTLSVFYGGRNKEVDLVDEMSRFVIDEGSFISVSGEVSEGSGDVNVKSISLFKLHVGGRKFYAEEEHPATKSFTTWIIFGVLASGVGYYIYRQRTAKPKHKGILQQ